MPKPKPQRYCKDCSTPIISRKKRCWDCEAKVVVERDHIRKTRNKAQKP